MEETLSFLVAAVRAGKIHYVGLANFTGGQLQLMVSTAKAMGAPVPVSLQQQYNLLSRESDWEILPAVAHNGMALLPWSPLADGFLSGKYQRGGTPASGTRAGSEKPLYQWTAANYASSDRNWNTIDTVTRIARGIGATPAQVALSWLVNHPGVTVPVMGARNRQQLVENVAAAELVLDEAATAALDAASATVAGTYPYGAFAEWQRGRWLHQDDASEPPPPPVAVGSDQPLGRG